LGATVAQGKNAFVFHTGGKQVGTDAGELIRQERKACPVGYPFGVRKLAGLTKGRAAEMAFRAQTLHEFELNDIKFPVWKHETQDENNQRETSRTWVDSSANSGVDPVGKRDAKPAKKDLGP
jgi:hypothetical protein